MKLLLLKSFQSRIGNHLQDCHCLCESVFLVSVYASKEPKVLQTGKSFCLGLVCDCACKQSGLTGFSSFSMWSFDSSRFQALERGTKNHTLIPTSSVRAICFSVFKRRQKRRISVTHFSIVKASAFATNNLTTFSSQKYQNLAYQPPAWDIKVTTRVSSYH